MSTGSITDIYFNTTRQLLLCGTSLGFFLYDVSKNKQTMFRDFSGDGGLRVARLLEASNLFGFTTNNDPNTFVIWEDFQKEKIMELPFKHPIKSILMTKQHIIITLENKIYIFSFTEKKLIKKLKTGPNPKGLSLLSEGVLIFPSAVTGNLTVYSLDQDQLLDEIQAHQNEIEYMGLSADHKSVFTASTSGTIIRGHSIESQETLFEFRRGLTNAKIYCIGSDLENKHLVVTGNTGTVHLYSLDTDNVKNKKSSLGFFKNILPGYFSSQWSHSSIAIKNSQPSSAIFRKDPSTGSDYLVIAFLDGAYFKYKIESSEGETTASLVKRISLVSRD